MLFFTQVTTNFQHSGSCPLNTPQPHGAYTTMRREDFPTRLCWLSSSLGEVNDKPQLAFRAHNELLLCAAEPPPEVTPGCFAGALCLLPKQSLV